jgi:hypothetical protein
MDVIIISTIDVKAKKYMRQPIIFADVFNYFIYDGETAIKAEQLRELDTTELSLPFGSNGKTVTVQKYRDVLKNVIVMADDKIAYALILGIENQTSIHYAMPVRNMIYDALNYSAQVSKKANEHRQKKDYQTKEEFLSGFHREDKLIPVVTLVVYFGQEPWDGPISIHEMLAECDDRVLRYVPDYKINLVAPISMTEEEINKFKSDFKQLSTVIHYSNDKNTLKARLLSDNKFKCLDFLTYDLISSVTSIKVKNRVNKKGVVNMCKAVEEMLEDSKLEGRVEGRAEGRAEGRKEGIIKNLKDMLAAGLINVEAIKKSNLYSEDVLAAVGAI